MMNMEYPDVGATWFVKQHKVALDRSKMRNVHD